MDKRKIRDSIRFSGALLCSVLYVPHLLMVMSDLGGGKSLIFSDVERMQTKANLNLNRWFMLLYLLHNNRYFRSVFYHRIGPAMSMLIGWWRPGDKYFQISQTTSIGKGFMVAHPFATIINAESIGDNFFCRQCTTLGNKGEKRSRIGNNVTLGASVTIIGDVTIGDNVMIGAGSVVVKDIPSNCVAVGNPARVIKQL